MSLRRRLTEWLADKARQDPTVTPEQLAHRQDFIERVEQERQRRRQGSPRTGVSETEEES